jgi:hypothetical protein
MSLKLNSAGGGSVTLQEPSTASNLTLDLPAASGTLATTAGVVSSLNGDAGALTGWQNIQTGTFSASSAINITGIASGYKAIQLIVQFNVNTDLNPVFRYSTDNGSTYIATNTYTNAFLAMEEGLATGAGLGTSATILRGIANLNTTARTNITLTFNQSDGTRTAGGFVIGNIAGHSLATGSNTVVFNGFGLGTTTYINAFQIVRTSGSGVMTGNYTVLGTK